MKSYNPKVGKNWGKLYILDFFNLQRLLPCCMLQSYCPQFNSNLHKKMKRSASPSGYLSCRSKVTELAPR